MQHVSGREGPSSTRQLCTKVGLCCISLVWFPDNGPLRAETYRNIKCDIVVWISKEQVCEFVDLLSWIYNLSY